ncbi:hypothetical protein EV361DRAFT_945796 [Lentinula raphanica]|uniref:TPR-like protein n=1 Tax=Lentinula raphanica TaxID=153919 RepID=A0AA38UG85_9AGAR|nr:hypothetical protein F5878DRAFT_709076 [Lentinula raphanica]KAJ3975826.1 hypothetical protein EV361DRAFT_945796 [Lentinula raphanica]
MALRRQAGKLSLRASIRLGQQQPISAFRSRYLSSGADGERRIGTSRWLWAVVGVGSALSLYGGYNLYQTLTIWPIEVRGDLRAAVRAKHEGDLELSQRFYNRAWTTIQTLPLSERSDSYYLKLTGLGIAFADVLEQGGKKEQAYEVYVRAWDLLQGPNITIGPVRLRAVSLASKLGDLAGELEKPLKEREKWLVWAVEEVLRVVKDEGKGELDLPMLALPSWIRKTDIGAPLEALGEFYEQVGNIEFAMPLYLHAISLLIPPAPKKSSPEDRCRAASLMTHLSSLILNSRPPAQSADDQKSTHVHQAESWAKQALAVATQARTEILHPPQRSRFFGGGGRDDSSVDAEFCDQVYAAALFNLGVFKEKGPEQ